MGSSPDSPPCESLATREYQQGTSASTVSRPQVTSGASSQSLVQGSVQSAMDGILSAIDILISRISAALRQPPRTQPTQPIQLPAATGQPQGLSSISTQSGQNAAGETCILRIIRPWAGHLSASWGGVGG